MSEAALRRRFFGRQLALEAVRACLSQAQTVRIATAFFEPGGWELLSSVLAGRNVRILVGRNEGGADRLEDLLSEFFAEIEQGVIAERVRVLQEILSALRENKIAVRLSLTGQRTALDARVYPHHAKLYIADTSGAIVTSANFTRSGLALSREAGYLVTEPYDVAYFVSCFDAYFDAAESLTEPLIEALEELLELRSPHEVYARVILEIYGAPAEKTAGNLPEPARYQQPIIARITRSLADTRGAFLVASTGLGKTVIAAHAVSRLKQAGLIHSVIVIAPAGLRDMWQQAMRNARVSSREYSYQILSYDDWQKYRQVLLLENELRGDLSGVLIILDESHHMRNAQDSAHELRLRNQRIISAVERGASLLLLTATPYSRSVDDINHQLKLLPKVRLSGQFFETEAHYSIARPAELSELPPCTVLTAPTVVRHFSQLDANGERYIIFSQQKRLYFPSRIHLRTVEFQNTTNRILAELIQKRLLVRAATSSEESLFDEPLPAGSRDALFEARLMHQFCSSHAQVAEALKKLSREGGYERMRFERQAELSAVAERMLSELIRLPDLKLHKLAEIIERHRDEKIVVFCIYQQTARSLVQSLKSQFPGLVVATTVSASPDELENILDFFAPVANGRIEPGNDRSEFAERLQKHKIDILIASEAIAEGFNLQDARILINYDLPWSVLHLAQRMGRLMRPWHVPRELLIYNFVPDTMFDETLRHGQRWRLRLDRRNREQASFANLPVILPQGDEALNLNALGSALKEFDAADLALDEAIGFIAAATQIQTSTVLDDLAAFTPEFCERILRLRPGFRSRVAKLQSPAAVVMLLRRRGAVFPAVFNSNAQFVYPPHDLTRPLELLRQAAKQPIHSLHFDPVEIDRLETRCLQTWLAEFKAARAEVRILCSLHFA
jgi:superfamily II DNA or RNA helicase